MPHPIQDFEIDPAGIIRFRPNLIVRFLLDRGPFDLNDLASMGFSEEDHEQFAMLVGYSLDGFAELSYVSDATYERAEQLARDTKLLPCPLVPDREPAEPTCATPPNASSDLAC